MMYEAYANKIKKYANVKNWILRYKFIILAVITVLSAAMITYSSVKGTLKDGISIASEYNYGDELIYNAEPVLSKVVYYEFKLEGTDEWTKEEPYHAGTYYIRAVTEKVGGYRYSEPTKFTIHPKEVELVIDEQIIEYGTYPEFYIDGLEYTDTVSGLGFKFDSLTAEKTLVNAEISLIEIKNASGVDVTSNYVITANEQEIAFSKRPITLKPEYLNKVYDGLPIDYQNTYTITSSKGLGYDDVIEITTKITDSQGNAAEDATLPGLYNIEIEKIILNNEEGNGNYDITKDNLQFEITKRPIIVKTGSAEKVYDGTPLTMNQVNISESSSYALVGNDSLRVDTNVLPSITNYSANGQINDLAVNIISSNGDNVCDLYDISYEYGLLMINKRDISLFTGSYSQEYDGNYISYYNEYGVTEGYSLAPNQVLGISDTNYPSIKNVGEIVNNIGLGIYDSNSNNVINNYNAIYDYGKITIIPRKISVSLNDVSNWVYNATNYIYPSDNYNITSENKMVGNEQLRIVTEIEDEAGNVLSSAYNSGKYVVSGVDYLINNGNKENYEIISYGEDISFEITKRPIKLNAKKQNDYIYDANEYIYEAYNNFEAYDMISESYVSELIGHEKFNIEVEFQDLYGEKIVPKNAGTYNIKIVGYDDLLDQNFEVSLGEPYEFNILRRDVVLKVQEQPSIIYNREEYIYPSDKYEIYDVVAGNISKSLIGNEPLDLVVEFRQNNERVTPIDAGTYSIYPSSYIYNEDLLIDDNYKIEIATDESVSFIIQKLKIEMEAVNQSDVYDGLEAEYENLFKIYGDNTFINSTATVDINVVEGSAVDSGVYTLRIDKISLSNDEKLDNYDVTLTDGTLLVQKRDIKISPVESNKKYDGNGYDYDESKYEVYDSITGETSSSLIGGEEISIYVDYYFEALYNKEITYPNAGTYEISISSYSSFIDRNYNVTLDTSILIIKRRNVVISLDNTTESYKMYDGQPYFYPEDRYTIYDEELGKMNGLIDGSLITIDTIYSDERGNGITLPVNAGNYTIVISGYASDNELVYNNFDISIASVNEHSDAELKYTIAKRPIMLEPVQIDETVIYNKNNYEYDGTKYYVYDNGSDIPATSLIGGEDITIDVIFNQNGENTTPIDAGTYYFSIADYDHVIDINYDVTKSTKEISLEIKPLSVSISPVDSQHTYDGKNATLTDDFVYVPGSKEFITCDVTVDVILKNVTEAIDADTYSIIIDEDSISILDQSTGQDSSHNYDVNLTSSFLHIYKRSILIKPLLPEENKVYDGEPYEHVNTAFEIYDNDSETPSYELIAKEELYIEVIFYQYDSKTGQYSNTFTPTNAGDYYTLIYDYSIIDDGVENNSNYAVSVNGFSTNLDTILTIEKRPVSIYAMDQRDYLYDNNPYEYSDDNYWVIDELTGEVSRDLIDGENINVTPKYIKTSDETVLESVVDAGEYLIYIEKYNIESSNYDITILEDLEHAASLTIKQRHIVVSLINQRSVPYIKDEYFYDKIDYQIFDIGHYDSDAINNLYLYKFSHYLLNGEKLYVDVIFEQDGKTVSAINAGTYNTRLIGISTKNNTNALDNYIVENVEYGDDFVIDKRDVDIKARDAETIYSGNEAIFDKQIDVISENGFIDSKLSADIIVIDGPAINVGDYQLAVDMDSLSLDGDLLDNYNITNSEYGILTIIARDIYFVANEQQEERLYDGNAYFYQDGYRVFDYNTLDDITDIVDEEFNVMYGFISTDVDLTEYLTGENLDELLANLSFYVTEAGQYNVFAYSLQSEMSNYKINFMPTSVVHEIKKRTLKFYPVPGIEYDYKGEEYYYQSSQFLVNDPEEGIIDYIIGSGQFSINTVITQNGKTADIKNVGIYDVTIIGVSLLNDSAKNNYVVETDMDDSNSVVELKINKKYVTISHVQLPSVPYDGDNYGYPSNLYLATYSDGSQTENILLGNDTIDIKLDFRQEGRSIAPMYAGIYDTYITGYSHYPDDLIDDNYNISYDSSIAIPFEITKREVSIVAKDILGVVYDGNEVIVDHIKTFKYCDNSMEFVDGTTVDVNVYLKDIAINAGDYELYISINSIEDKNGENVLDCYDVNTDNVGRLEIIPRDIIISPVAPDSVYYLDSNPYANEFILYDVLLDEFVDSLIDTTVTVDSVYYEDESGKVTPDNAGTYKMFIDSYTVAGVGADNYNVSESTEGVEYVVNKRIVTVSPVAPEESIYYTTGEAYEYDSKRYKVYDMNSDIPMDYLPGGEELEIFVRYENSQSRNTTPKLVGTYYIYFDYCSINGDYVEASNYEVIPYENGIEFEIEKGSILIGPQNIQKDAEYNGNDYIYPSNTFYLYDNNLNERFDNELPDGTSTTIEVIFKQNGEVVSPCNAGDYEVYISGYDTSIEDRYDVSMVSDYVTLTIKKKDVYLDSDVSGVLGNYNANPYVLGSQIQEMELLNGDVISYIATVENDETLLNAGEYNIVILDENIDFISGNGKSVKENYNFILSKKTTVTIKPATVVVNPVELEDFIYSGSEYQYSDDKYIITSINGEDTYTDTLLLGEKLSVVGEPVSVEPIDVGTYNMYISGHQYDNEILDEEAYDNILNNYVISFEGNTTITINRRPINIKPKDIIHEHTGYADYDTDEIEYIDEEYILCADHVLEIDVYYKDENGDILLTNPTEVGIYTIHIDSIHVYDGDSEVTKNYIINNDEDTDEYAGVLTIKDTDIEVSLIPQSKIYDGNPFVYEFEVNGEQYYYLNNNKVIPGINVTNGVFAGDDYITLDIQYLDGEGNVLLEAPVNAGNYYIEIIGYSIENADSSLYEVNYQNSRVELEITPRDVYIKATVNEELTYNFESQIYNITYSKKYDDDSCWFVGMDNINPIPEITDSNGYIVEEVVDAGVYNITISPDSEFINGAINTNYNIICEDTFEVLPLDVAMNIVLDNNTKQYDGLSPSMDTFSNYIVTGPTKYQYYLNALDIDILAINYELDDILNAGVYNIWPTNIEISNNSINNFEISYVGVQYTITQVEIDLELTPDTTSYNGKIQEYDAISEIDGVNNEKLKLNYTYNESPKYVGEYVVTYNSYYQYSSEDILMDVSMTNYKINALSTTTLTINKLEVEIIPYVKPNTTGITHIFNDDYFDYNDEYQNEYSIINDVTVPVNDNISFNVYYTDQNGIRLDSNPFDVGTYRIYIDYETIDVTYGNTSIIENYNFINSSDYASLEIIKYDVTVIPGNEYITYGEKYENTFTHTPMLPGYSLELSFEYSLDEEVVEPINAATYDKAISGYVIYKDGIAVEDTNFSIDISKTGILVISQADLEIYGITNISKEYDGEKLERDAIEYDFDDSQLKYNDSIDITTNILLDGNLYNDDMIHADKYTINIEYNFTKGNDTNYNIIIHEGFYEINPRLLSIYVSFAGEKVYDGMEVIIPGEQWKYQIDSPHVLKSDSITTSYYVTLDGSQVTSIIDAGTYSININDFNITGFSKKEDYVLECIESEYVINKRNITVLTPTYHTYYYGEKVTYTDGITTDSSSEYLLVDGHKIVWDGVTRTISSVPRDKIAPTGVENIMDYYIAAYDENGNEIDVTSNYNIVDTIYGKLYVYKRPIIITTNSETAIYNGILNPLSNLEYTITDNTDKMVDSIIVEELSGAVVESVTDFTEVFHVTGEEVDNVLTINFTRSRKDVTDLFYIEYQYGKLKLEKRSIDVYLESMNSSQYNGSEIDLYPIFYLISYNQEIDIRNIGDIIDLESSLNLAIKTDKEGNLLPYPIKASEFKDVGLYDVNISDNFNIISIDDPSINLNHNYNINIIDTSVEAEITPLEIIYSSISAAKIWDGSGFNKLDYIINESTSSLPIGHKIVVDEEKSTSIAPYDSNQMAIKEGIFDNHIQLMVMDENGNDVSNNYLFTEYEVGKLYIVKDFYISYNDSNYYTGEQHIVDSIMGGLYYQIDSTDFIIISNATYRMNVTHEEMIELGEYDLIPDYSSLEVIVSNENNKEAVSYINDELSSYKYKINPIPITVLPKEFNNLDSEYLDFDYTKEDVYLRPEYFEDGLIYNLTGNLLFGHYIEMETSAVITLDEIKKADLSIEKLNEITSIRILDANNNNKDVTGYYDIITESNFNIKLTINKKVFMHKTGSITATYDGTPKYNDTITNVNHQLLEGHSIKVYSGATEEGFSVTDYTKRTSNTVNFDIIANINGQEVSVKEFYVTEGKVDYIYAYPNAKSTENKKSVTVNDYGTIQIKKRSIRINTGGLTVYENDPIIVDGQLYCEDYELLENEQNEGLLEGHRIVEVILENYATIKRSKLNNKVTFVIEDADGNDVSDNYTALVVSAGTLEILPIN